MKGFVQGKQGNHAASPARGRVSDKDRRLQKGLSARVEVPPTNLRQPSSSKPGDGNANLSEPSMSVEPSPPTPCRQSMQQPATDERRRDNWDTDTDHFDESTAGDTETSDVLVGDSQPQHRGFRDQQMYSDDGRSELTETVEHEQSQLSDNEDEDMHGKLANARQSQPLVPPMQTGQGDGAMMVHMHGLDEGDSGSYPTTTAGDPESQSSGPSRPGTGTQAQYFRAQQPPSQQFASQISSLYQGPQAPHYNPQQSLYAKQMQNSQQAVEQMRPAPTTPEPHDPFRRMYKQDRALKMNNRFVPGLALRQNRSSPQPEAEKMASKFGAQYGGSLGSANMPQNGDKRQQSSISLSDGESESDEDEQPAPEETQTQSQGGDSNGKSNDGEPPLDYNDDELHSMPYSDLAAESFDHNARARSPSPSWVPDQPLSQRLEHVFARSRPSTKPDKSVQKSTLAFLASLSLEEWEETGDWILGEFGTVLKNLKDARKEKRNVAAKYEEEIRKRSELVQTKRRRVEDVMAGFKVRGKDLLEEPKKKGEMQAQEQGGNGSGSAV